MKVHVNEMNSYSEEIQSLLLYCAIKLDDQDVTDLGVVAFDTEVGWVECFDYDEAGKMIQDPETGDPITKQYFGLVEIVDTRPKEEIKFDIGPSAKFVDTEQCQMEVWDEVFVDLDPEPKSIKYGPAPKTYAIPKNNYVDFARANSHLLHPEEQAKLLYSNSANIQPRTTVEEFVFDLLDDAADDGFDALYDSPANDLIAATHINHFCLKDADIDEIKKAVRDWQEEYKLKNNLKTIHDFNSWLKSREREVNLCK